MPQPRKGTAVAAADLLEDVELGVFPAAGLPLHGDVMAASWQSTMQRQITVAVSRDRGATWEETLVVSSGETTNVFPWVAVRGQKVAVAWYEADRSGTPASFPPEARWVSDTPRAYPGGCTSWGRRRSG